MIRTGYSFRTAVGHLPDVISRVGEIGWEVAPIADRCSTFGFVRWTKLCEKAGLRPVYGVELNVTPDPTVKKPIYAPWTFLARDDLRAVHDLIWQATGEVGREPSLRYEEAMGAEGVVKIAGPASLLDQMRPQDDLHVGLSLSAPRGLVRRAISAGHQLVAAQDNRYPRPEDQEMWRVALGGRITGSQTYPMHLLSDEEWRAGLSWLEPSVLDGALAARSRVLAGSTASLRRAALLTPEKPLTLLRMCQDGAEALGCDLSRPVYAERLGRELGLIAEKDFEDYFYIVADIMRFARANMVVGPARGSSCGSLVCYLLGITSIDPIPFDLVFERFIDVTRTDLPDIDLDFSDVNRHLVFEYVSRKYGRDRSARLGSVNMFKARAAFNAVGASLKIPSSRINEITNTVIKRSMGDSRASSTIDDTFSDTDVGRRFIEAFPEARITGRLEGHPSVAAQHAAGVVVTQTPVRDYVAVDRRTGATMCDKKDAEELNLLKIDALGLSQLSIFERCLELIGRGEERNRFLEAIPLDDQAAFDVLNNLRFSGVFQFIPGAALTGLVRQMVDLGIRIDSLEDLVSLTALVRPGPLGSGATDQWMQRRAGRSPASVPHPSMEPYLSTTLGIVIYQEQVLSIGREIGGLSWEDVTQLRKAMSRSLGKEFFDQYGDRWKAGAIQKTGMPSDVADKLWDELCAYGMWAFNRSHSVAYAMVSYWCLWLKAHHPLEFAAATLDSQTDPHQQIETLRELREEGVSYVAVDPELSTDRWVVAEREGRQVLVGPLTNVRGIGPKTVIAIMDARRRGTALTPALRKKLEDARTPIDSLSPIEDAIGRIDLTEHNILTTPTQIRDVRLGAREIVVIAKITKVAPLNENEPSRVAKRKGRVLQGPTDSVNLFARDDTGEIFCKIGRFDFTRFGRKFVSEARAGKSLYAIKGEVPADFRMIYVQNIRHLGEVE